MNILTLSVLIMRTVPNMSPFLLSKDMFFVSIFVEKNLLNKFYSNTVSIFVMKNQWKDCKNRKKIPGRLRPPYPPHIDPEKNFKNLKTIPITIYNIHLKNEMFMCEVLLIIQLFNQNFSQRSHSNPTKRGGGSS